ncbi:MAG: gamma-glutamyltransferase [Candidatus Omnitrophica bacterium]|nr:gamma-glutamyltransferase [Candidatus Omnitrophota bacterium]
MAVTAHPLATETAVAILENGGNAADAAIAAQWVLNVVEPQSSGIGGGGFFLFYDARQKKFFSYDGREKAPEKAFAEMFLDANGRPYPHDPSRITGGLPVGVPGILQLLDLVYRKHGSGKFSFELLFDPAIRLAEEGFEISPRTAHYLKKEEARLRLFGETRRIFFDERGKPFRAGHTLKQPDLARTFQLIQKNGPEIFYEGEIADSIVEAVKNAPFHPGLMEKEDLKNYRIAERAVVSGRYRGYDIFSMGPPSSGGTTLLEALNILELYPLAEYGQTARGYYFFSRAQALAFEDRNRYLGDPDFAQIPVGKIISKEFARQRNEMASGAKRPRNDSAVESPNTSHISIVDEEGNMAAFTTTIEAMFGSGMVVPGRGFFLNNELTDFEAVSSSEKNHPNAPGPAKRPRSSMTPTFIFQEGRPFLIIGSPGGSRIIGAVFNVIVNIIDFGMTLEEALAAPRLIHRGTGIEAEEEFFQQSEIVLGLEQRGMKVSKTDRIGNIQAIHFDSRQAVIVGAGDPRGEGKAKGY